jgi:hypothetical protein
VTTTNIRAVGLVLTVLNHFHLFPSGPLVQSAEGARRVTYLVSQSNHGWSISPRCFLTGQRSGVEACLHKSSPHEQPGDHFPEFSQSRTKLWQGLLTLAPRRPKDRSPTRTSAGNLQSSRRPGCGDSLESPRRTRVNGRSGGYFRPVPKGEEGLHYKTLTRNFLTRVKDASCFS